MVRHTTSSKEVIDLLIAWLGVSFAFYLVLFLRPNLSHASVEYVLPSLIITLVVVGSSFVLHELLHKFTAQHFGFWSEFRASYTMLVYTSDAADEEDSVDLGGRSIIKKKKKKKKK